MKTGDMIDWIPCEIIDVAAVEGAVMLQFNGNSPCYGINPKDIEEMIQLLRRAAGIVQAHKGRN